MALQTIANPMSWEERRITGEEPGDPPSPHNESMSNGSSQPARILLVEDDLSMQHMVVNYLEQHNIRLVSGFNRQEVAGQFCAGEARMVILHLRLGREDGLDLLR